MNGPKHEGWAASCEVLGKYVTVICGDADTAVAVVRVLTDHDPHMLPYKAVVGACGSDTAPALVQRKHDVFPTRRQGMLG